MKYQNAILVLNRWGLTFNQAKIYINLLQSGTSKVQTISKGSGIAPGDVYRVLSNLERIGLVEKLMEAPIRYRAIPIEEAISTLESLRMEENSKLKKISKEIIQNYTYEMETQCLDTEQFTMLSSKRYFVKIKKKLENIQTSLDTITSSENPHSILHICEEELILAIQRGFRVRIMTNKLQEGKPMDDLEKNIEKHPNFEIRYIKKSPSVLINIYDKHEASLFTGNPSTTKKPTLWVSNPGMLSIFQKYYDTLWSDAIKN